jgi:hypothetical protein
VWAELACESNVLKPHYIPPIACESCALNICFQVQLLRRHCSNPIMRCQATLIRESVVKVTNEPELLRRMYGVRSLYRRNKGHVAYQFKPGHDNIISVMDDGKHTRLRSKMFAGVSSTIRSRPSLTVCSIQERRMTIS